MDMARDLQLSNEQLNMAKAPGVMDFCRIVRETAIPDCFISSRPAIGTINDVIRAIMEHSAARLELWRNIWPGRGGPGQPGGVRGLVVPGVKAIHV